MKRYEKSLISIYIFIFIVLFFLFLIVIYAIPNNFEISIVSLIGFALFIAGFFYFLIFLNLNREDSKILKFKTINENLISLILIILMGIFFFIPPISFSEMIIDWNQIPFFNYLRGIIFIIGCSFIPGLCIFNILFPGNTILKRFNIDPIIIKLVVYPLLSFTLLGSFTFIFDHIGLTRSYFSGVLFLLIVILFILNFIIKKRREKEYSIFKGSKIIISKQSIFILFLAVSIIIISLGIHLKAKYLFNSDFMRAINYTGYIGNLNIDITEKYSYLNYWSYISFSISSLSGIPAINVNVLLFPFIYLLILSIFIFVKALLFNLDENYAILSTILIVSFSPLFYFYNMLTEEYLISQFTIDTILTFRYKGFAISLFLISIAFLIILFKTSNLHERKLILKREKLLIIIVSAFFLIQSYMIYFVLIIPAFSLATFFLIFTDNKRHFLKIFNKFMLFFICFLIFFDIISNNYFNQNPIRTFFSALGTTVYPQNSEPIIKLIINSIIVYSGLILVLIFNNFFYKISNKISVRIKTRKLNRKNYNIQVFQVFAMIFTFFLMLEIMLNLIRTFRSLFYFTFILHLLFYNIGFIGILGFLSAYFCFKENKKLFYILTSWLFFMFGLSLLLIFYYWFNNPNLPLQELPARQFGWIILLFNRFHYYTFIPLSIFLSIALIKFRTKIILKISKSYSKFNMNLLYLLVIISAISFFSFSNTIIGQIKTYNYGGMLNDEEAQIIGWVSQNVPDNSRLLVDSQMLLYRLKDIANRISYPIDKELEDALQEIEYPEVITKTSSNCSIKLIEELFAHNNVLQFEDQNPDGGAEVHFKFFSYQSYGTIDFYIQTSNKSKSVWLNFSSYDDALGFSLNIKNGGFYYFNGSTYIKISEITNYVWYKMKFDFECTDRNYSGLNQYHWKIVINQSFFGEYAFVNNVSNIGFLSMGTSLAHFDYRVLINDLNVNWNPNFKIEYCLFDYLKIFKYLKERNVRYLILSKEDTEYKKKAEEFIDIENDLIPKFYKNKLYEYQDLVIYSNNF